MVELSQLNLENISESKKENRIENKLSQIQLLKAFGYTQEDESFLMNPMAQTGAEAIGSMGTDTPVSALSNKSKLLYTYFKQNFAQVTNPPIDPIREEIVMSLVNYIGKRGNILDIEASDYSNCIKFNQPILREADINKIVEFTENNPDTFKIKQLDTTFIKNESENSLEKKLSKLCSLS